MEYSNEILKNEKGIVRKEGIFFHNSSDFAQKNLFYLMWGGKYTCTSPYRVDRGGGFDSLLLFYVFEGTLKFEYMGSVFEAESNDTVLIDCTKECHYYCDTEVSFYWFHFNGRPAHPYFHRISASGIPLCHSTSILRYFEHIHQNMQEELVNEDSFSADVHAVLARFMSCSPVLSPGIRAAKDYMDTHFGENILIDDIAEVSSFSKYHFSRLFARETGLSPHRYLMDVRINHAKHLLAETNLSVEEIAGRCSFCSPSNFIRTFRKSTALSPLQFRNTVEKN